MSLRSLIAVLLLAAFTLLEVQATDPVSFPSDGKPPDSVSATQTITVMLSETATGPSTITGVIPPPGAPPRLPHV
ncbi:hypothetical protein B0H19DRAFT_1250367 [Mycena capillaripes]|nr:hypothetical protein B0H19DRAFT_1250367 [Mycena capillaripes]